MKDSKEISDVDSVEIVFMGYIVECLENIVEMMKDFKGRKGLRDMTNNIKAPKYVVGWRRCSKLEDD